MLFVNDPIALIMIKTGSLLARQTALDLSHHTPHVKHPDAGIR